MRADTSLSLLLVFARAATSIAAAALIIVHFSSELNEMVKWGTKKSTHRMNTTPHLCMLFHIQTMFEKFDMRSSLGEQSWCSCC